MYKENEKSDEPVRMLRTVFLQNGKYYQLQVATSMVEEDDLIKQLFYSVLWLYLGLVITIILFNNFLLKRIWRPFHHLLKEVMKFRLDKPKPIIPVQTKVDEFVLLNETVQKLLQRNIDTYATQKSFIENAAHELQTPLAISINKLEALAENNELPESQLQLLASALDNLERLARLNRSLLLLSKIENKQFAGEAEVQLLTIAKKIVEDFSDQSGFYQLDVTVKEKGNGRPQMNEDLATVMLTNLIKNAIIHNKQGGFVTIIVDTHSLIVENSGVDHPLDKRQVFERFYTGDDSQRSTGLGLPIVKAIANLYHFKLDYQYQEKHIITVDFTPHISPVTS
jgi:signal transduction histidine kinase